MHRVLYFLAALLLIAGCTKNVRFEQPVILTGEVKSLTDTSAVFTARISHDGKHEILEAGFQWGMESETFEGIILKYKGIYQGSFSAQANKTLLPEKTYFVRAFVKTQSAITYGNTVYFETPEAELLMGYWKPVYEDEDFDNYYVRASTKTSFTLNGNTYLLFADGELYAYDHASNTFNFVLSDPRLIDASTFSTVYQDHAYIFFNNAFYRFNDLNNTFHQLAVWNEHDSLQNITGFRINHNIYAGLGKVSGKHSRRFFKYDIAHDIWHEVAEFGGSLRQYAFSFSIDGTGYAGGGFNHMAGLDYGVRKDFWHYRPESDQWFERGEIPFSAGVLIPSLATDKFGYCFISNRFYRYLPHFDYWLLLTKNSSPNWMVFPYIFEVEGRIFVISVRKHLDQKYFRLWSYEE